MSFVHQIAPEARRYDPVARDFPIAPGGQPVAADAIDEGMALSLGVELGSCPSSPTTGHTLHEIKYLGGVNLQSDVTGRVMRSQPLARFVLRGDVKILNVWGGVFNGALYALVSYSKPKFDANTVRFAELK